ncbi:efflux RND transporter periplasmic adaptor subunit [Ramlibacter tataouinensis]|uniref:Candidate periplasmic linker protein n=1 Tax=Ramlibacter tataouinensis (strain ATCC BAA-407 / DSM 14655 / LMG 21543 / TTB310) TaxID=365046 RepID=F5Y075_RAMTT|nr:efflux RND transporter periplasmic adaptor subunit [Ramlibacter tataouinensis]AEG94624.1 Candidate periplasmic linker protein [Ramlibacter tataouinensis TTB310]
MKKLPTPTPAPLLALLLAAAFVLAGCKPAQSAGGPPQAPPVSVAPAVVRSVADSEEFTGRLEAPETVEVRPRVGGTVEQVHFADGARVARDALLFTIDPRPYEAEVQRAQAQLAAARTRAELAKAELARAEKLVSQQAISRQEYDQLASAAGTAQADIGVAEAAVRIARLNLGYTAVRAPIAGRASRALITTGNLVTQQSLLTTVVSTHRMQAYFDGSEQTFLRLRRQGGELAPVRMGLADDEGYPRQGRVDFVDNRLNAQTGAIRMRAVFDNAKGDLAPGLFARIQMPGGAPQPAVLTPERAIGTDQNKRYVFVVGADNMPQFREVKPGPLIDGMRVVTSGLKEGELVIVDGLQRVRPGMAVAPTALAVDERGMPVPKAPGGNGNGAPAPAKS